MRGQKGITLIALIITIIVLLILAVVAITTISNTGIINHAKNAQTLYDNAQTNEQEYIDWANSYITTQIQ